MTPSLFLPALTLLAAAGWCVLLVGRPTDWRPRLLAGLLGLVSLGHLFSLVTRPETTALLPVLGVSVAALLTVALLDRIVARHKIVELDLGTQKAYLEELFESSPEAIVLVGSDGRVLRANKAFGNTFGYSAKEIQGQLIDDVLAPAELVDSARAATRKAAAGAKVSFESVRRRKDGSLVEVSILGAPVKAGGQIAIFGIYRDITKGKRVELERLQLEKAVQTTQIGVTVTDLEGRIIYTNRADAEMHGYTVDELMSQDVRVFAPPGTRKRMGAAQLNRMTSWRREGHNVRKDGSTFPVHLMSDIVRSPTGEAVAIVTTCEDITRRKAAELALSESEERYALAARGSNDGLWDWNLETGDVYYSDRWKSILGYSASEIAPRIEAWLELVHEEDLERVKGELDDHLEGRSDHFENEHRVRHKNGSYRWVLMRGIAVRDDDGKPHRIAGSLTDTTHRKKVEQQLARDALYDPLTDLPNRAFFTNLLDRAMRRRERRKDHEFAVMFLDIDRFKLINDSLGHTAGDHLLVGVAQRLVRCLRPGDVVARLAGDEFCILLDDIKGSNDATRVAERIQEEMTAPFGLAGREVFATMSIGIALSESSRGGPEHLLRDADTAMYRAKSRGKARFELFDQEMHRRAVERLQQETNIREALDSGQFRLVYQPVLSLEDQSIRGFEALLRWEDPKRGLVPPSEFVPLAEETGLIVPIGLWVLRSACQQMAAWAERFPSYKDLSVSVNLSAKQLQQTDLADRIAEVLEETKLEPHRLRLEIPETVLLDDPDFNMAAIRRLNDLGVHVQIDDFGTGYSSFAYLNQFDIDTLKIDRSVISRVGVGEDRSMVAQAMITLARDLGIHVIAEGVETAEQSATLKELKCEQVQGYLYSRPVDAEAAASLLDGQKK